MKYRNNVDYVRKVIAEQVHWTADYVPLDTLPEDHRFHQYQEAVNAGGAPSQTVIAKHIDQKEKDYRLELAGEHPIKRFRKQNKVLK